MKKPIFFLIDLIILQTVTIHQNKIFFCDMTMLALISQVNYPIFLFQFRIKSLVRRHGGCFCPGLFAGFDSFLFRRINVVVAVILLFSCCCFSSTNRCCSFCIDSATATATSTILDYYYSPKAETYIHIHKKYK